MTSRSTSLLYPALLAALVAVSATCLVSLMYAFMGISPQQQGGLAALHLAQQLGVALAAVIIAASLSAFALGRGLRAGIVLAWAHIPGWMLLIVVMMLSLAILGELSYFLLRDSPLLHEEWVNHAALLCLAAGSVSVSLLYAYQHAISGRPPYDKHRW